jgi:hypothetical protein
MLQAASTSDRNGQYRWRSPRVSKVAAIWEGGIFGAVHGEFAAYLAAAPDEVF